MSNEEALTDDTAEVHQPPEPAPRRDDAAILKRLTEDAIVAHEQVPQGSNYSFVVGMSDSGSDIDLLGIYKPRRGEIPLWDFPSGTLFKREYAAYLVSVAFGWQYIPPTVIREGPYGEGSVQLFVQPVKGRHYFEWRDACVSHLMRLAIFDYITNNADRKSGHCLLGADGQVWAIDHGLTFNVDPKLRTVIREFAGDPLPDWLERELQAIAADEYLLSNLAERLEELLDPAEVRTFLSRFNRVLTRKVFPRLDRYDSVPREWW